MPKYSVIIPVYNVEKYLENCIESVLTQSGSQKVEIILVDDGSPDRSGVICDEYAAKYPHIRVIHQENRWLSGARNAGLRVANGEYVIFLDSDDFWEPGLLTSLDTLLEQKADMALFGYTRVVGSNVKIPSVMPVIPRGEPGTAYLKKLYAIHAMPFFFAWCYAYRRMFLLENQLLFREELRSSEDFEYNMRAIPLAQSIVGTEKTFYNYIVREGSLTTSLSEKKLMDNLICKADVFRRYPTAAVANFYADNALLISRLPKSEVSEALDFLKKNRDIWNYVSQRPLKLGCALVCIFGDYLGAQIFVVLRKIIHSFCGKT